jgi:hypothetical protein
VTGYKWQVTGGRWQVVETFQPATCNLLPATYFTTTILVTSLNEPAVIRSR